LLQSPSRGTTWLRPRLACQAQAPSTRRPMPPERFVEALNEQVANEFGASHQYVAIAANYEAQTLPQLAGFFYTQAVEEREHAMMMIKYLLDTNSPAKLRQITAPESSFSDHIAPIR